MVIEIKVPPLSESITEATLLPWRKQEGEYVAEGENLIDIETDKVVMELQAPKSGVIAKILKPEGAKVAAGEPIALLDTAATAPAAEPVLMMPAAKKIVEEQELDASRIAGSGRGGRITKEDVLSHQAPEPAAQPIEPGRAAAAESRTRRVPMSRVRERVAERLVESQHTAAILTTFNEVNMQAVVDLRSRYREKFEKEHGVKLGFNSFFVKAAVAALKKFPVVNASIDGKEIVYHDYYDIGIAVGSPRGLVVPVVRDADRLSLAEIEKRIADFGKRSQDGKLAIDELLGGTFSITNGGVFGSMLSTPIINPPQSAILGIHAMKDRPVAENGAVVIRPMVYLALSYDHRLIDGRDAVLFLVAIKEAIEDPARLMLEI